MVICINIVNCALPVDPLSAEKCFHWGGGKREKEERKKTQSALGYLVTAWLCYTSGWVLEGSNWYFPKTGATVDALTLKRLSGKKSPHHIPQGFDRRFQNYVSFFFLCNNLSISVFNSKSMPSLYSSCVYMNIYVIKISSLDVNNSHNVWNIHSLFSLSQVGINVACTSMFSCCEFKQIMAHVTTFQWFPVRTTTARLTKSD